MTEQEYIEKVNLYKELVEGFNVRKVSPFAGDAQRGTGGEEEHFANPENLNKFIAVLKTLEQKLLLSNSPFFLKHVSEIQKYHQYMVDYAVQFGQRNPNEYKVLYPAVNSFGVNLKNTYLKQLKQ